jgi:hypothetical protein
MADHVVSSETQLLDSKAIIDALQQDGRRSMLVYLKTVKQQYNWGAR